MSSQFSSHIIFPDIDSLNEVMYCQGLGITRLGIQILSDCKYTELLPEVNNTDFPNMQLQQGGLEISLWDVMITFSFKSLSEVLGSLEKLRMVLLRNKNKTR